MYYRWNVINDNNNDGDKQELHTFDQVSLGVKYSNILFSPSHRFTEMFFKG